MILLQIIACIGVLICLIYAMRHKDQTPDMPMLPYQRFNPDKYSKAPEGLFITLPRGGEHFGRSETTEAAGDVSGEDAKAKAKA